MLTIYEYDVAGAGHKSSEAKSKDSLGNKLGWQLALEKAYIQGKKNNSLCGESKRPKCEGLTSGVEYIANNNVKIDQQHQTKIDANATRSSARSVNMTTIGFSSLALSESMPKVTNSYKLMNGIGTNQNIMRQDIRSGESIRLTSLNVLYPHLEQSSGKESMSLLNADEGIHLLIRSVEMSQTAAIKISENIQRVLAGKGRSLVKVILNGKCITPPPGEQTIENADEDHKINLTY